MGLKAGRVGIHPSQVDPITGMLINGPTPGSISFEDLSDAQIDNPEVGQTLIYNGTGWENEFSSISPTTLAALQDVQITDPEDGDYLTYDAANSKWINSGEAPAPAYTDITVTMYGAVEDTISFTDADGISHSEVFASGQSSKSVTFKINPSGSTPITFTSAVAKDPSNLSNDYTKTISVTSATTEIKVMPDNALYWWGYMSSDCEEMSTANGWTADSGYTWNTPTYNTNSVTITGTASNTCGIAKKTALASVSTLKAIVTPKEISSFCGWFTSVGQKNLSSGVAVSDTFTGTVNTTMLVNLTNTANYYPILYTRHTRSFDVHAFWYE